MAAGATAIIAPGLAHMRSNAARSQRAHPARSSHRRERAGEASSPCTRPAIEWFNPHNHPAERKAFAPTLRCVLGRKWKVYLVLTYAQHVAISNRRLVALGQNRVTLN
jgi:hypothetical protein